MSVEVTSRIPEIVADADIDGKLAVQETVEDVAWGARFNLVRQGSVVTGELIASLDASAEDFEGEVGTSIPYAKYVEFGTGVRGSRYQFPGKPDWLTYDMTWLRGIPKQRGFAFLIPALQANREAFEERIGHLYR